MPKFMMIMKGDQPPGELPSEEMLAAMGEYNDVLATAGVLVDLAGLHPSAEGVRVRFAGGERTVLLWSGIALVVSRVLQAIGVWKRVAPNPFRFVGSCLTLFLLIYYSVWAIVIGYRSR